ncbi:hypothetical protein [Microcoleus sp. Pol11C3]|uniref:hypothetical protein n=1 Tax=Microcoleus sp. Pol11C3 TaxID=3055390 RepID=UPI002FD0719D
MLQPTISTIRGMVEIEQVELNREQEERERQRDREQMEIGRKNPDKEQKGGKVENIIFFVGTAIGGGQIFWASYPLIKHTPIK